MALRRLWTDPFARLRDDLLPLPAPVAEGPLVGKARPGGGAVEIGGEGEAEVDARGGDEGGRATVIELGEAVSGAIAPVKVRRSVGSAQAV